MDANDWKIGMTSEEVIRRYAAFLSDGPPRRYPRSDAERDALYTEFINYIRASTDQASSSPMPTNVSL